VDLETKKLIKSIPTGAAQDSSIDSKNGRYYVSVSAPPHMAIVDSTTLEVTGEVSLPAPADLLMFAPASGMVIVCNDDDPEEWVIDPQAKKIVSTTKLPGKGMEDLAFSPDSKRLFQVMKEANAVAVIDAADNKVTEIWPTAPAANPHGMAMVAEMNCMLVAGGSGKLAMLSLSDGKVMATADIASKVDEMAYDAGLHRAYCASGTGKISVVAVEAGKLTALGDVAGAAGCHSIVVDPKTHVVWIAYAKGSESYAQPFTASPETVK
jgi:DNA-binding beta-propeller fold protein YncE